MHLLVEQLSKVSRALRTQTVVPGIYNHGNFRWLPPRTGDFNAIMFAMPLHSRFGDEHRALAMEGLVDYLEASDQGSGLNYVISNVFDDTNKLIRIKLSMEHPLYQIFVDAGWTFE